jgi:hypothetical protein
MPEIQPTQEQDIQEAYMNALVENIGDILTEEQKSKYCLIFGDRVVGQYDTLESALQAQHRDFAFIMTVMYYPPRN